MKKVKAEIPAEVAIIEQKAKVELATIDLDRLSIAAQSIKVETATDYVQAGEVLKKIATAETAGETFWAPKISAAHLVHAMLLDLARPWRTACKAARDLVEGKMGRWKKAEELRAKKAQEELHKANEDVRTTVERQAADLAERGYIKEAAATAQQARTLLTPTVAANIPKLEGIGGREPWEVEVTSLEAFILAVADGIRGVEGGVPLYHDVMVQGKLQKLPVLDVNTTVCKRRAAEMNGLTWAGIEAVKGTSFSVRR